MIARIPAQEQLMHKCRMGLVLGLVMLAIGARSLGAHAVTLYATADFNVGVGDTLYRIDTTTQTTSRVSGTAVRANIGLADYDGRLFGYDQFSDTLQEIDPDTGAQLASFDLPQDVIGEGGLAIDSSGIAFVLGGEAFQSYDLTSGLTAGLNVVNPLMDGLDFDSHGTLFGLSQDTVHRTGMVLHTINPIDGSVTLVGGSIPDGFGLAGLTFDANDTLYAINKFGTLFVVDASDGSSTVLFETGLDQVSGLSALPEPTASVLLSVCLLVFGARRRAL